jgi:inositol 1,4,5-triphosphate receptor type 3
MYRRFELVDFPNENTVLKFNPSLNFQKLRTNVVYHGDVVCLSANKLVCNRNVGLYSTYTGHYYDEVSDMRPEDTYEQNKLYISEIQASLLWASVDDFS